MLHSPMFCLDQVCIWFAESLQLGSSEQFAIQTLRSKAYPVGDSVACMHPLEGSGRGVDRQDAGGCGIVRGALQLLGLIL